MTDLRPTAGVRYLLERRSKDAIGPSATYRGAIFTATAEHGYALELGDGGTAELTAEGERAAEEHETGLLNVARSMARAATRRRMEGLKPWPDRVLKWRGPSATD